MGLAPTAVPPPCRRPAHPQGPLARIALLAGCGAEGCTEAVMLVHGFMNRADGRACTRRLATATAQRIRAGGKIMEVATLRITRAGRKGVGRGLMGDPISGPALAML